MDQINAELCSNCPARGLCIGDVALSTVEVVIPSHINDGELKGIAIVGTDSDGIRHEIETVVPEYYTTTGRKGKTSTVKTRMPNGTKSDEIFKSLEDDPDYLLTMASDRASRCEGPGLIEANGGMAISYYQICRAISPLVLNQTVQNKV